jgi:hypothetical protein
MRINLTMIHSDTIEEYETTYTQLHTRKKGMNLFLKQKKKLTKSSPR